MTVRVLRYEVPVDDQWHTITSGDPVYVDARTVDTLDLWALDGMGEPTARTFRVFGTGQPVPDGCGYRGTALSAPDPEYGPRGTLVWHLFERLF